MYVNSSQKCIFYNFQTSKNFGGVFGGSYYLGVGMKIRPHVNSEYIYSTSALKTEIANEKMSMILQRICVYFN